MNIHQLTFSPTGGTRRVSKSICKAFDVESNITELCTKKENLKYPDINIDDLVVISMPVYAGRVPALAVERLKALRRMEQSVLLLQYMVIGHTRMPCLKCRMWQQNLAFR